MSKRTKTYTDSLPSEVAENYPELTLAQYRLLCYIAYCGGWPGLWSIASYDAEFNIKKGRTNADRQALRKAGLLIDIVRNRLEEEKVVPSLWFGIVIPMMRNHPDWCETFAHLKFQYNAESKYLWLFAECISSGDMEPLARQRYPEGKDVWQYFEPFVLQEDGGRILSFLPDEELNELLKHILDNAYANDSLGIELLDKVRMAAKSSMTSPEEVVDQADAFRYFLEGTRPAEKAPDSMETLWSESVRAISLLYKGYLPESFDAFRKALLKDQAGKSFRNNLLNWFWAICLIRNVRKLGSNRAKTCIEALMKDSTFKYESGNTPAWILLTYLDDNSKIDDVISSLSKFIGTTNNPIALYLGDIVAHYYRINEDQLLELGWKDSAEPRMMILRSEASPVIPTTTAAKNALQQAYGGPGTLTGMLRKEAWEMALSSLSGRLEDIAAEQETKYRIIYFFTDKWITGIMEQSRKSDDEEWGNDRLLSRSILLNAGYDSMDTTDIRVARAIGNKRIDIPDLDIALPLLAGTGRIFQGPHYHKPYREIPIEEEAPFVAFTGNGGIIEVSSNAACDPDGMVKAATIIPRNSGYTCIRTNPIHRDILNKLLKIKQFPASAANQIRATIESLEGIIEVRSSLGGHSFIPTLRGSTRLALRLTPEPDDKNSYLLDIHTSPNEDGFLRCEPGQGAEDVYDDTGENAVFIHRDLQQEYDNYMELRDAAENDFKLEFSSPTSCTVCGSESLLNILVWAYDNRDKCFVEWPEGRPLRFRGDVNAGDIEVSVRTNMDWFSVEGELKLGEKSYDLDAILAAMRASDVPGYIKLGDKDYVRMSKILRKHLEALDRMMTGRNGSRGKSIPPYRVGQLAEILGDNGGIGATMDDGFKTLLKRMQDAYDSTPELPSGLNATMREYQVEGYRWMKRLDAWGAGACLADDMGLGKTLQSLAFILSKAQDGPSLVIAPKSVVPNWDIEAAKFTPSLKVSLLNSGSPKKREAIIASAAPGDVILATYGVLSTESKLLASREWNVVCLDEAHQIKNRNTRISCAAMGLNARSRIILTGTPIQNHLGELWNLFQFINPGLLGDWPDFKARYMMGTALDDENKVFLKDLVQPFILRRTKDEVLKDLPEKIVYEQMVELSMSEMQLYEAMRQNVEDYFNKKKKEAAAKISFFGELTNLRLASCSMSLVHEDWKGGSSKLEALKGIIDELSAVESNRVIVFSQFTSFLGMAREMLDKEGYRYFYLDGQTDLEERGSLVTQFQNGDCPIFLVSLKAGGLGLNLTAANYVILLDPWWNPAIENQAMDRAHRFGQKRNVTVIRLISKHTIEEKILRLHETKLNLSDEFMEGTADSWNLTMDDILEMVSPFR
ncbi:MAG: SNF2-related protein [Candidatus Cryptobacteroides sp.]